eukprot:IDg4008t1
MISFYLPHGEWVAVSYTYGPRPPPADVAGGGQLMHRWHTWSTVSTSKCLDTPSHERQRRAPESALSHLRRSLSSKLLWNCVACTPRLPSSKSHSSLVRSGANLRAALGFELFPTYRLGSEPVPAFLLDRCDHGNNDPEPGPLADRSIIEYAREYPGTVIIVDKIGARSLHPGLTIYRRESAGKPRRGSECIQMAIINAVRAVRGEEEADATQRFLFRRTEPIRSLKRVGPILREASVNCGVWIVHLEQRNQVDHAVCIDCERKLIWDSEEECALRLNTDYLMMCGGPECDSIRIKDIRKIVPWNT